MKWMKAVLCSVLLGVAGTAIGSDDVKESPRDYATSVMLEDRKSTRLNSSHRL